MKNENVGRIEAARFFKESALEPAKQLLAQDLDMLPLPKADGFFVVKALGNEAMVYIDEIRVEDAVVYICQKK